MNTVMNTMAATQDRPNDTLRQEAAQRNTEGDYYAQTGTRAQTGAARKTARFWPAVAMLLAGTFAGGPGVVAFDKAHDRDAQPIALVNGTAITRQAFTHRLETASGNAVLQQMLAEETQMQFARQYSALPNDAQVQVRYDEVSRQPDFARNLALIHQTPDDVKHALQVSLVRQAALTRGVQVSNEDVANFYKANADKNNPSARYYHPETVTVAAILSDKEADIDHALHELATGRPFAQVAQTYSRDSSKANGGLLAPIQRGHFNAKQFPGLEAPLFSLKVGEQIDKSKVAGAWWILRCVARTPEQTVPFPQVAAECRTGAMLTKGLPANAARVQSDFAAFQKSADINIVSPDYKALLPAK